MSTEGQKNLAKIQALIRGAQLRTKLRSWLLLSILANKRVSEISDEDMRKVAVSKDISVQRKERQLGVLKIKNPLRERIEASGKTTKATDSCAEPWILDQRIDEAVYTGQYKNEGAIIREGYGLTMEQDGSIYEGYYQGNKRHGFGRLIMTQQAVENLDQNTKKILQITDSMVIYGLWKNDELCIGAKNEEDYLQKIEHGTVKLQSMIRGFTIRANMRSCAIVSRITGKRIIDVDKDEVLMVPESQNELVKQREKKLGIMKLNRDLMLEIKDVREKRTTRIMHGGITKSGHAYSGLVDHMDRACGYGLKLFEDGSTFEGFWFRDGTRGFARMIYANGEAHEGDWKREFQKPPKRHGRGTFWQADGSVLKGEWIDDMLEG